MTVGDKYFVFGMLDQEETSEMNEIKGMIHKIVHDGDDTPKLSSE
jgi:hypothetical protein